MERIKNQAEKFYREIRSVEIYDAKSIPYIDVYNGIFPNNSTALYIFNVTPETLVQNITTKRVNKNDLTEYDITFSLLDLAKVTIETCEKNLNKKDFAIVMESNVEKILFGNDIETIRVDFIDNKKNDGSGEDECTISIIGQSIIKPKIFEI